MAGWRPGPRCCARSAPSRIAARRRPASSPAAPFSTGAWTCPRSRASPTSSMPRPRRSAARPCASSAARSGHAAEGWREEVLQVLALLEASLDFSDEGDVPEDLEAEILAHDRPGRRTRSVGLLAEPQRRAPARGPHRRARRPAQCRQVDPAQCACPAGCRHRLADRRHHPGRDRGPLRSRRPAGGHRRYGRPAGERRSHRAGGRLPRPRPGAGCRSRALARAAGGGGAALRPRPGAC